MGRWFFSAVLIICSLPLFGQRIENLRAFFAEGKVTILYDIAGGNENQTYSIQVFGSHNNYSTSLHIVQGDVGVGIKPGRNLTIIWDAQAELGTHSGGITFRVSGNLIPMKLTILSPATGSTSKRGRQVSIRWEGGLPDATVKIELYRGDTRIMSVGESKNLGSYSWHLPKDLAKGVYNIHLTAGTEKVITEGFIVKAGLPKVILVGTSALVVGAVVWLLLPDSRSADEKLPVAPDPQ